MGMKRALILAAALALTASPAFAAQEGGRQGDHDDARRAVELRQALPLTRILEIDRANLIAIVEPNVINGDLQRAVEEVGLFYPPDPASRGSCFLGGNLANNSGGPKAVKYGVTRDYVINMEVVLPTGEIIWTAANVLKNSTGYNLTQLMCGSEGTLGIITKIVFKLRGLPQKNVLLLIPFVTNEEACSAIAAIFVEGITPSGMEFFEREAAAKTFDYCTEYLGYLPFGMYHWICVNGRDIANLPFEFSRDDLDRLEAENLFRKTRYWVDPTDELHTKTTYEINGP